jgi:hypothetical protein
MDGLLITVWTQRFTGGEAHEIIRALQTMHRTGELRRTIKATAIGDLTESRADWRHAEGGQQ